MHIILNKIKLYQINTMKGTQCLPPGSSDDEKWAWPTPNLLLTLEEQYRLSLTDAIVSRLQRRQRLALTLTVMQADVRVH